MQPAPHLKITGVDTHAHIFKTNLPMAEHRRYAPSYDALPETFLTLLVTHGLSHGVLVQPSFLGTDNQFMLSALRECPQRLKGIAVVDPTISDLELDELDAAGVVGIRLNLIKKTLNDYTTPLWRSLFARLEKRAWSVEIQREISDLADFLPTILDSGVEVVVDHFARTLEGIQPSIPSHRAFLTLLNDAPIWTKISAAYRCDASVKDAQTMLATLRDAYGHSDRLLWGSDWPHTQFESQTNYSDQYRTMRTLLSDEGGRDQVLIHNPTKLFRF